MGRIPRLNHSPAFKSKVALTTIKDEQTISALSQQFDVLPSQITQWKTPLLEQASTVFEKGCSAKEPSVVIKNLHAKIGELVLGNDFLEKSLTKAEFLSQCND